jgi:hypothetical protein
MLFETAIHHLPREANAAEVTRLVAESLAKRESKIDNATMQVELAEAISSQGVLRKLRQKVNTNPNP